MLAQLRTDLGLRDGGFALLWLLALVCLIPAQLISMIGFDESGLDTLAPSFVFMVIVPAALLTIIPTLAARRLYTRKATLATAALTCTLFTAVATYTTQLYAMCGAHC